jgi:hypothetical protein
MEMQSEEVAFGRMGVSSPNFASHSEVSASPSLSLVPDKTATFEIDLSLPGVQLLLLVMVEVQRELRRKYGAEGQKKAS